MLIGTQMVAKGHHFPGVELAAVVDADTGLGLPDFRAEERTFQLVTQLAGRSGRDAPGRVIVQTFQPDARAIALRRAPRRRGLHRERARAPARARLPAVPPPRPHRRVRARRGGRPAPARGAQRGLRGDAELLGPAPLLRLRGRYRAQLVGEDGEPPRGRDPAAALLAAAAPAMRRAGLPAVVDVDPQEPVIFA